MRPRWDDNGTYAQARILAFDQLCTHDEEEHEARMMGAGKPKGAGKES